IKGGRTYANEVLNDCLYAVFNQFGSAAPQTIAGLLPQAAVADATHAQATDSLDIAESQRIEDAVRSLIEDLQRGQAIPVDVTDEKFTWFPNAGLLFSLVRRLEAHETELVVQLKRAAAQVDLAAERVDNPQLVISLRDYATAKRARADEVANLETTITL